MAPSRVVLPTPGPPVTTAALDTRALYDRGSLGFRQRLPRALLHPREGLGDVDRGPWRRSTGEGAQTIGDAALGDVETTQEDAGLPLDRIRDHFTVGEFRGEGGADHSLVDLEQSGRELDQFLDRQSAVALVRRLLQSEGDSSPHALRRLPRHPELHRDGVGDPKPNAADVARQPIGVLGHDLDGVVAVGLEDADRARRADAVGVEEDHDVAHGLPLGPAGDDLAGAEFSDARYLAHPFRRGLDDLEGLLPEGGHDPFGQHGTDAAHHAGAEVFLDPLRRRRRRGLQKVGFELEPVAPVGNPDAEGVDEFSRRDRRHMPDDGDEVTFPARLHL